MKVSIGGGLRDGSNPTFKTEMHSLGFELARAGHEVVLGKYQTGLLKELADGVKKGNGKISLILVEEDGPVSGPLPSHIVLDKYVAEAQHETALVNAGDAFIAGYGGTGTFADLARAFTIAADAAGKRESTKPVIIYGEDNPLAGLVQIIKKLQSVGLSCQEANSLLQPAKDPSAVLRILGATPTF